MPYRYIKIKQFRLLLSIFLITSLQSCVTSEFIPVNKKFDLKKILSDTNTSYIYRTQIILYNKDFSGLLVIKPETEGYRIVFLNEIGMKFFDLELLKNSFKVHHIFDPMNKKMFIKLLIGDFNFILMNNANSNIHFFKEKKTGKLVVKQKSLKEIYYIDKNTLLPQSAFKYSILRKTTFLKYKNYTDEIPKHIKIKHKNIKFEMNLNFIK